MATSYSAWITSAFLTAVVALAAVEIARTRIVPREAWLVLLPVGYWTLSFALTRESWSVYASPDFMRRDGAMFASLAPLAALPAFRLDRRRIEAAVVVYFGIQAAVAMAGGISAIGGWLSDIYRPAVLVDGKPTLFGLYVAHNAAASLYVLLTLGALAWALRPESEGRLRVALLILVALLALGCFLA